MTTCMAVAIDDSVRSARTASNGTDQPRYYNHAGKVPMIDIDQFGTFLISRPTLHVATESEDRCKAMTFKS